jgi:hypothetical protein
VPDPSLPLPRAFSRPTSGILWSGPFVVGAAEVFARWHSCIMSQNFTADDTSNALQVRLMFAPDTRPRRPHASHSHSSRQDGALGTRQLPLVLDTFFKHFTVPTSLARTSHSALLALQFTCTAQRDPYTSVVRVAPSAGQFSSFAFLHYRAVIASNETT